MQPRPPRPTGVTILAILAVLGGLAGVLGGAVLIGLGLLLGTLVASVDISNAITNAGYPRLASYGVGFISAVIIVLGVVALVLGILYLAVGIGFFGGKGWAWTLGIIVAIIGAILAIVQIAAGNVGSIVSLLISVLILYYLTRTRVKAFFGKSPWTPPSMGAPTMGPGTMTTMGSSSTGATMIRCASCGAMAPAGTMTCPSCGASL